MQHAKHDEKDLRKFNAREIELLILYGSAASEAMSDYPCYIFQIPNCTGIIAYRVACHCAIIFGDPLCPPHEINKLLQAFHQHCHDSHFNIIYIAITEQFARIAQKYCAILLEACEELIFNPQINPIFKSHRLHHRMDKAIKHGLTFHEYIPFNQEIENSLLEIGLQWQKAKKEPGFYLGHLNFFESTIGKRWFYVKDGDLITSMAMLCRIEAQNGWLLKFFVTLPNAFPETSEFLMVSLLTTLKNENCHFLTKGIVPIDSIGEMHGLGRFFSFTKYIYKKISFVFDFKKHKQYWQRYYPIEQRSFLLFSNPRIGLKEIRALLKVLKIDS